MVHAPLSRRERDVIALIAAGVTDHAIAERLGIAGKTVSHHVGAILLKLDANRRTDAAIIAVQLGLIELAPMPDQT